MIKPEVLVCANIPDYVKEYLDSFCSSEFCNLKNMHRADLLALLKNKKGVIISGTKIDKEFFDNAPELRAVCSVSVGYNNIDIAEAKKRGIVVTNTPGVLDETVADLVFALIFSVSRRICELDAYVREGRWQKSDNEALFGQDVHHTTLGIVGMGRIGEAVAKRASGGFSMKVLYHNRNRKTDTEKKLGVEYRDLETLLRESDFVLLMTPLTEGTRRMIGGKEFALMKKSAFFINASRGQTVDETALIEALKNKTIAGAGLDVFDSEPVSPENPLLGLKNVVLLPHIGSATHKTRGEMAMLAAKNLKAVLQGEKAITPVFPD